LSEICYDTYSKDAVKYGDLCYEAAKKGNEQFGIQLSYAYKGMAYRLLNQQDSAEFYFRKVVARLPNSNNVIQSSLSDYVELCIVQKRYELADSILHLKIRFTSGDYGNLACLHAWKGRQDSADYYLSLAEETLKKQEQRVYLYEKQYLVALFRNDYKTALEYKNKRINLQDGMVADIYRKSVADYQRNYEQQQKEIIAHREEIHKLYFSFVCVILLILLITVSLYFYYKNRASKQKMEEYLEAASVLTHTLMVKDNRIKNLEGALSDKSDKQQSQQTEMQAKVQKLFAGQFAFIDSICSDMLNNKFDHKLVYERLQSEIQKLTSDEQNQSQLEAVIDEYFNNIMKRLRATGIINGNGAQLLSYMIARFRNKSIMLLMDIEEYEILKKRKSRLKEKLRNSGLAEAKEALSYISDKEE
jgi:hypothetical protein